MLWFLRLTLLNAVLQEMQFDRARPIDIDMVRMNVGTEDFVDQADERRKALGEDTVCHVQIDLSVSQRPQSLSQFCESSTSITDIIDDPEIVLMDVLEVNGRAGYRARLGVAMFRRSRHWGLVLGGQLTCLFHCPGIWCHEDRLVSKRSRCCAVSLG